MKQAALDAAHLKFWHLEGEFAECLRSFSYYLAVVEYDVS